MHFTVGLFLAVTCLLRTAGGKHHRASSSSSSSSPPPTWEDIEVAGVGRVLKVEHLDIYPAPYLKITPLSPPIRPDETALGRPDEDKGHHENIADVGNSQGLQVLSAELDRSTRRHKAGKQGRRKASSSSSAGRRRNTPFTLISGNPLKDQPNLSEGRGLTSSNEGKVLVRSEEEDPDVIEGSRQAFTLTKMDYLKKEMCKTQAFKQAIEEPGCDPVIITNQFCYGQCNSFFIPKWETKPGGAAGASAFRSVAHCRPHRGRWIRIRLHCPRQRPRRPWKRVYVVKDCKCMAQELPMT